jgi:chromate transporter
MTGGPTSAVPASTAGECRPARPRDLFRVFNRLALQGFGGVLPVAQRVLVEEQRWLTPAAFLETLSVSQVLPGPNVVNLALIVGDRFFGWRGAVAALAGMLGAPLAIVLTLAALVAGFAQTPAVAGALRGMGAVSAGLILASALKLMPPLRRNPLGPLAAAAGVAAAVFAVGLMRWPMAWVLLVLGGLGMAGAYLRLPAPADAARDADRGEGRR